nr:tRNA lysidine(34) synthetase TilS [Bacteroidota bacterium]
VQGHLKSQLEEGVTDLEGTRVPLDRILEHGTPKLMLHKVLRHRGFHPDRLDDILKALENRRTGAIFLDGGVKVTVDRNDLIIEDVRHEPPSWTINELDELPENCPFKFSVVGFEDVDLAKKKLIAWLDLDRLVRPLVIRPWRNGDRMKPIGLNGSKLISDLLIDAKVARNEKERTYVIESGGKIVLLIGHRIGDGFEATERSGNVLRVEPKLREG